MPTSRELVELHRAAVRQDQRVRIVARVLRRVRRDDTALDALLLLLDQESDADVRLSIVQFLRAEKPLEALWPLTKQMFDPDPVVRAQAAAAVAEYEDPRLLARSLDACLNALLDPATRHAAERVVRTVTGRPPAKISQSERERVRLGEHPSSVWPDHFAALSTEDTIVSAAGPGAGVHESARSESSSNESASARGSDHA